MARGKAVRERRIRMLKALQGRRLDEVYLQSPEFRKDLEREATRGDKHFGDALLTTEMLAHLDDSVEQQLLAGRVPLQVGERPSAAFPIASPSALLVPVPPDQDTVVIVPGNAASSLVDVGGIEPAWPGLIWINPVALALGRVRDLELAPYNGPSGEHDNDPHVRITAPGTIPMLYDMLESDL